MRAIRLLRSDGRARRRSSPGSLRRRACRGSSAPSPRSSSRTAPARGRLALGHGADRVVDGRARAARRSRPRRGGAQGILGEGAGRAQEGDAHGQSAVRAASILWRPRRAATAGLLEGDRVGGAVVVGDLLAGTGSTVTSSVSGVSVSGRGLDRDRRGLDRRRRRSAGSSRSPVIVWVPPVSWKLTADVGLLRAALVLHLDVEPPAVRCR